MAKVSAFNLNKEVFPPIVHDPKLSAKDAADPFAATHKLKYGVGGTPSKNRRRNEARRAARQQERVRAEEDEDDAASSGGEENVTSRGEASRTGTVRKEAKGKDTKQTETAAAFEAELVARPKEAK